MSIKTTKSSHLSEQSQEALSDLQSSQLKPNGAFIDPHDLSYGFILKNLSLNGATIEGFGRVTDPWMNCIIEALIEADDKALESKANNC